MNDTLSPEDRAEVMDHLQACTSCRRELREVVEAYELFDQHVPSLDLSLWAHGLPTDTEGDWIESHCRECSTCRVELERLTAPASRTAPGRAWTATRMAAASGLVALVLGGGWIGLRGPQAGEPEPEPSRIAAAEPGPTILFADGFEGGTTQAWKVEVRDSQRLDSGDPTTQ